MRIAPMLIPHLMTPSKDLWVDTALSAMITHNDPGSNSACIALIAMLWELIGMKTPPEPFWYLNTYAESARALEGETRYSARGGSFRTF